MKTSTHTVIDYLHDWLLTLSSCTVYSTGCISLLVYEEKTRVLEWQFLAGQKILAQKGPNIEYFNGWTCLRGVLD